MEVFYSCRSALYLGRFYTRNKSELVQSMDRADPLTITRRSINFDLVQAVLFFPRGGVLLCEEVGDSCPKFGGKI